MSELIDRERFSADMRDFQNRVGIWRDEAEDTETRTRADAALATIIETKLILDKQPTIPAPRWHRVEEEPIEYQRCMVYSSETGQMVSGVWTEFWWMIPGPIGKLTHWMPIEPPKEGV